MTDSGEMASEPASTSTADSDMTTADSSTDGAIDTDTSRVGIRVTETELRFMVNTPSDIDSGWIDPDASQYLVGRVTWE